MDITLQRVADTDFPQATNTITVLLAYVIFSLAVLVILGWITDIHSLTGIIPGFPTMKVNTAIGFMLASAAIRRHSEGALRPVGVWLGPVLMWFMGLTLLQYPTGFNLGIDNLFWQDTVSTRFPGRPSMATSTSFLLIGAALTCAGFRPKYCRYTVRTLLVLSIPIPITALLTYFFEPISLLSSDFFSTMAIHTACLFLLCSLAIVVQSESLDRSSGKESPGLRQLRRLLVPVVIPPVIVGMLVYHHIIADKLSVALGLGLLTSISVMIGLVAIFWNTLAEGRWYEMLLEQMAQRESIQRRMSDMLDSMQGAVLFCSPEGAVREVNSGAASMFRAEADELIGLHLCDFFHPDHRPRMLEVFARIVIKEKVRHLQRQPLRLHLLARDGSPLVVLANVWETSVDQERVMGVLLVQGSTIEQQLKYLKREIRTDHLTSALNRGSLESRFHELDEFGSRRGESVGLIMIDIDHFKVINDSYGHPVGDSVLAEFSQRINDTLRYTDTLYRYGGEEFTVLVIGATNEALLSLAERIRQRVEQQSFTHESETIAVTCSLGIAQKRATESCSAALARADHCLYQAKQQGRNRVVMA